MNDLTKSVPQYLGTTEKARLFEGGYQDRLAGMEPQQEDRSYSAGYAQAICDEIGGGYVPTATGV